MFGIQETPKYCLMHHNRRNYICFANCNFIELLNTQNSNQAANEGFLWGNSVLSVVILLIKIRL